MNENYIHYIQSNTKLVQTVDELSVADTGTTGHYMTLDSTCDNKQQAIHPLPIQIPNREIITLTHTALLSQQDVLTQSQKAHIFQGSTRPCCPWDNFAIMDGNQPLTTSLSSFSTKGVEK